MQDENQIIEDEIKVLESKKLKIPKGWRGFFTKRQIQNEINQRRKYLNDKRMIKHVKVATELTKEKTELAKAKSELNQMNKQNIITFEQLQGGIKV